MYLSFHVFFPLLFAMEGTAFFFFLSLDRLWPCLGPVYFHFLINLFLLLRVEGVNGLFCFILLFGIYFSVGGVGYYALYFSWLISFL